jgi:LAO/AO transport system kinase
MINAAAPPATDDGRPRPKRPEVLVATATTGEGVSELLAALDRHRAGLAEPNEAAARLARADAQLQAALADRLRERLGSEGGAGRDGIVRAIAAHELDPYAAADRVLASLTDADGEVG